MDNVTNLMNQNWIGVFVGLVGVALAILSLVAAYVFYRRSRPQPKIAFQSSSNQFPGRVRTPSEEIQITFRGQRVPQVTKSLVAIWNSGNTTIEGRQIVDTDPLRIVTSPESQILDVTILRTTREVNQFSAEQPTGAPNEVCYRFDWLDPGDGALIKMLHTGERALSLRGTIRGVPKGVSNLGVLTRLDIKQSRTDKIIRSFTDGLGVSAALFLCLALGIGVVVKGLKLHTTSPGTSIFGVVLGLIFSVGVLTLTGVALTRLWQQAPTVLRLHEGD